MAFKVVLSINKIKNVGSASFMNLSIIPYVPMDL